MTRKQKLAAQKILENPSRPISVIMKEVGYSPNTAVNPKDLTESKGWKQLMEEILPDERLLKAHADALEANKWNDFTGEREPDHTTRLKAVDLGYKVKHKADPQHINPTQININLDKYIK